MTLLNINLSLAAGEFEKEGILPRYMALKNAPFVFQTNFGLDTLPTEPGILLIRGARQYGKSTWLEQQIAETIKNYGSGSAFFLDGEYILNMDRLEEEIDQLLVSFSQNAPIKRIFIDEITAIDQWEIVLKRMADRNKLKDVLIITTGSSATDIRRGVEKLPGRKGKLGRSEYIFTPISYNEFKRVCGSSLKSNPLLTYLLSGGSPIACTELALHDKIPEYLIELVKNWVDGELARSGRSRSTLLEIMNVLFKKASTPIGQAKLAREAGISNNTVAQGYIDVLNDLGCVIPAYPWDQHKNVLIKRKECKYHLTNLLVAIAYYPERIRSVNDFTMLDESVQGHWIEWFVAQELLRRETLKGENLLSPMAFWSNKNHELDFVCSDREFIEVKRGKSLALENAWFPHQFPHGELKVINNSQYKTDRIKGLTLEDFFTE